MATFETVDADSVPSGTFYPSSNDAVIVNIEPTPNPSNGQTTTSGKSKTTILTTLFVLLASMFFGSMWCFGIDPLSNPSDWGWDEFPFTTHIKVDGKDVELRPEISKRLMESDVTSPEYEHLSKLFRAKYKVDLKDKNLMGVQITRYTEHKDAPNLRYLQGRLSSIDFTGADLRYATIRGVTFYGCSFDKANLINLNANTYYDDVTFEPNCSFHGAQITYGSREEVGKLRYRAKHDIQLFPRQIKQTANFKDKSLVNCSFPFQRFWGMDFSNFILSDSKFLVEGGLKDCKFDNATIYGCTFADISFQQLASTKDFRSGCLTEVELKRTDFSFANLSRMILLRCTFGANTYYKALEYGDSNQERVEKFEIHVFCDFNGTNLSDAVITHCDFEHTKNLTVEQIKSTWNYKQN
ncbi:MAG: pentapeptide repeat-containing protein, partial [Planctomycetaceae bacterium]|nr:pentapeptide repeat-containing protein [Planctomycetaceae bacterium]